MTSSATPMTETKKYGEKLHYDPEFRGPVKSRSCTDIICLFLFVSFLAGWAVVAFFAYREGDPRILLYPTDSEGNICGVGKLKDKKFLYFFDLMKCASPAVMLNGCPTPQVCVEQCPNETFFAHTATGISEDLKSKLICKYNVTKEERSVADLVEQEDCAKLYLKSKAIVGRCIPEVFLSTAVTDVVKDSENKTLNDGNQDITVDAVKNATGTLAKFLSVREFGDKVFSDFKTSWHFILLGLFLSMVLSLIWIILMRWVAGPMVWLSIFIALSFSLYACYYSTTQYIELKKIPESKGKFKITLDIKSYLTLRDTWLGFAIVSGLVFAILALVILFLRKRIFIAIALIKEASRAVGCIMTSLIFPLLPYLLMIIFFVIWASVALFIASSGKASFVIADAPKDSNFTNGSACHPQDYNLTVNGMKCLFKSYGMKDNLLSAHAYNVFGLFWGLFFAVGIGQVSLAGAFSAYYWTLDKRHVPTFAVGVGLYRCVRYHMGSVAFGSLLIAIIRFIRVVLEYIDQQAKKYDNKFTKMLLWCCKCCFWILENIVKFISKNAYIMIAVYGKNFCKSAKKAFMLLMRNIVRVVVLDKITDFLLFLGKLVVVSFSAVVSFYFFATEQKLYKGVPTMNFRLLPPIFITAGSYLIASAFFSVYGMAVDTLFLCFLEDCERNDGSPEKPYYMSKELMKILDKRNKYREPSSSPR